MPTLVIVGGQWGDEAKGKLVDAFAGDADVVVRYAGGNNAGHTVIVGGAEFKFQLLPSGILCRKAISILSSGMVVCPEGLLEELDRTRALQPDLGELKISSAAHVVFPYHKLLDALEEEARGANKIGTTSRGIGPAYQDKVARIGIRMCEFVDPDRFRTRLREVLDYKNRLLVLFGRPPLEFDALYEEFSEYAKRLRPMVAETEPIIQDAVASGKRVLFEGAQGTFLDLDSGTYPYVTSSHPVAGGAALGSGIGPRAIDQVIGVVKAYTTRVGSGPFPTELHDAIGEEIRQKGHEFGTVTGRSRRIGWLDLAVVRHSARLNSMSGLAITRLDILSGFKTLKVCVGYRLNGETIRYLPCDLELFSKVEPVYEELPGWDEDLTSATSVDQLPKNARGYLEFVERHVETPVAVVSIGPSREQTIVARPDLIWG